MENKFVVVRSARNCTLVVNVPSLMLHRVWNKKGAFYPIDRDVLFQAYYDPAVETLFKEGSLYTDDVEFLKAVGLMDEENVAEVTPLTDAYLGRLIKFMPLVEVKQELKKMTAGQLDEIANYAVEHYQDLSMDRIDLLTKATGKNIMNAINHLRKAQEV